MDKFRDPANKVSKDPLPNNDVVGLQRQCHGKKEVGECQVEKANVCQVGLLPVLHEHAHHQAVPCLQSRGEESSLLLLVLQTHTKRHIRAHTYEAEDEHQAVDGREEHYAKSAGVVAGSEYIRIVIIITCLLSTCEKDIFLSLIKLQHNGTNSLTISLQLKSKY